MLSAALDTNLLVTFAITAAVIIAMPGPSVMFIVSRALTVGRPAAIAAAAGNTAGNTLQGVLAALGVGSIVSGSEIVYNVVKFGGALYLVQMGARTVVGRRVCSSCASGQPEPASGRAQMARQGFIVGMTNPKTIVFFASTLPQFVNPERGNVVVQMLVMMVIFGLMSLVGDTSWSFAGSAMRQWTTRSPHRIEYMVAIGGVCIIGLGLMLALSNGSH
jgi:threonine/homoserine/homoserine lactone efflux protein